MNKVFVFFADGFEEIEGLTVVDILRRADVTVEMISVTGKKEVTGSHGITVKADFLFEETDFAHASMYVLPGGMPGTKYLGAHEGLASLLSSAGTEGKKVAAICAAPSVLGDLVTDEEVVVSGDVITSRGMGTAIPFALALVGELRDQKTADELGNSIIWRG